MTHDVTLSEKHTPKVFESRVVRKILEAKRNLHNEKLHIIRLIT
jgi:hypothetical protein